MAAHRKELMDCQADGPRAEKLKINTKLRSGTSNIRCRQPRAGAQSAAISSRSAGPALPTLLFHLFMTRNASSVKEAISILLPQFLKRSIRKWISSIRRVIFLANLWRNYFYDYARFVRWSAARDELVTREQFRSLLTRGYHSIEKGLALRDTRVGFGLPGVQYLIKNIHLYIRKFGADDTARTAIGTLRAYCEFNKDRGQESSEVLEALEELEATTGGGKACPAGVLHVERQNIWRASQKDLSAFFESRHSVRDFADQEVDLELIEKAVRMAQKTPSVCNRQSSRVYLYTSREDCRRVLACQNGNRGFGEQVNKVIVVASNVEQFGSIGERNQCWIDGGMFAMSLVYALHSLSLGTCCLNWNVEVPADRKLRKVGRIPDSEAIIMLIAVGHLPETFKVATSARKQLREILFVK